MKEATIKLWARMAGWSREQLVDAGALMYFAIIKDLAHVAGVFEVEDWFEIDPRAERFRPLLNDELADTILGELVGSISLPTQQISPFGMMQHSNRPARVLTPLPYSVLAGDDFVPSVGGIERGSTLLEPKVDRYRTCRGVIGLKEYNRAAREFTPESCKLPYRYLCETWVKYHAQDPRCAELYRLEQAHSRELKGRGL
jgi:hypothetical protein